MKPALILLCACLTLVACMKVLIPVKEDISVEIGREVNWAVIALNNFAAAIKDYSHDFGEDPDKVEDLYPYLEHFFHFGTVPYLEDSSYIENSPVHKWWKFNLGFENDRVTSIFCVSSDLMIKGAGHRITYSLATARFTGYGLEYINPEIYPFLMECFIDPHFILVPGETWDPEEAARHFLMIRQVNWAAVTIGGLYNAIKMYWEDNGEDSEHPDTLEEMGYALISPPVHLWWDFAWSGLNPITHIHAISTELMVGGVGDTLTFNTQTGMFEGKLKDYMSPWAEATNTNVYIQYYIHGARKSD